VTGSNTIQVLLKGKNLSARLGENIFVRGHWNNQHAAALDSKPEFVVTSFAQPTSQRAWLAYLASGSIPYVGPAIAEKIVNLFRDQTLNILLSEPERLQEIPGIGRMMYRLMRQHHTNVSLMRVGKYDVG